jgi:hypothetical protein
MHRVVLERAGVDLDGKVVDHINGNALDNRRSNLRAASKAENSWNSKRKKQCRSGFKGVRWHIEGRKWQARIKVNGREIHGGLFNTPEEAAHAYDQIAVKYFGAYAKTNF